MRDARAQGLARLLKQTREDRGVSQMELAMRLGVSQRHISFVEIARARPGRDLLLQWMREVGASATLRNAALLGAGYAPLDGEGADERAARPGPALAALGPMLAAHDPFPGLVFDADWRIVRANRGAAWLDQVAMPHLRRLEDERGDMLLSLTHPAGMLSHLRDPGAAAAALLTQLRAEQWTRPSLRPRVERLERSVEDRFGSVEVERGQVAPTPQLHLRFDTAVGPLAFLTLQTVLGLPQDVTPGALRLELWYPADADTAARVRRGLA